MHAKPKLRCGLALGDGGTCTFSTPRYDTLQVHFRNVHGMKAKESRLQAIITSVACGRYDESSYLVKEHPKGAM